MIEEEGYTPFGDGLVPDEDGNVNSGAQGKA